jgi:hypothetical protein
MTYGKSKQRDMVRSILPSSSRGTARDMLNVARRKQRRRIDQALQKYRDQYADVAEEIYYGSSYDYHGYDNGDTIDAMWRRREADKVAPLMRWGAAVSSHLPLEERYDYLRAMFPDNKAGRHALQHLYFADGIYNDVQDDVYRRIRRGYYSYRGPRAISKSEMRWRLYLEITKPKGHKEFNRWAKRNLVRYVVTGKTSYGTDQYDKVEVCILEGVHDIERFVDRIYQGDAYSGKLGGTKWSVKVTHYLGLDV